VKELVYINPKGLRTGFDPTTQRAFNEDPSSTYQIMGDWADPFGQVPPGDPGKSLAILDPVEGVHRFQVIGTGNGPFTLKFSTRFGVASENVLKTVNDVITKDQILKYELQFSKTSGSSVSEVVTFTPRAQTGNDVQGLTGFPGGSDRRTRSDATEKMANLAAARV
jgi:hypothetical protein